MVTPRKASSDRAATLQAKKAKEKEEAVKAKETADKKKKRKRKTSTKQSATNKKPRNSDVEPDDDECKLLPTYVIPKIYARKTQLEKQKDYEKHKSVQDRREGALREKRLGYKRLQIQKKLEAERAGSSKEELGKLVEDAMSEARAKPIPLKQFPVEFGYIDSCHDTTVAKGKKKTHFKVLEKLQEQNPPVIVGELGLGFLGPLLLEIKTKSVLGSLPFKKIIANTAEVARRSQEGEAHFEQGGSYYMFSNGDNTANDNNLLSNATVNFVENLTALFATGLSDLFGEEDKRHINFGLVRTENAIHQGLHVDLEASLIKNFAQVRSDDTLEDKDYELGECALNMGLRSSLVTYNLFFCCRRK